MRCKNISMSHELSPDKDKHRLTASQQIFPRNQLSPGMVEGKSKHTTGAWFWISLILGGDSYHQRTIRTTALRTLITWMIQCLCATDATLGEWCSMLNTGQFTFSKWSLLRKWWPYVAKTSNRDSQELRARANCIMQMTTSGSLEWFSFQGFVFWKSCFP